jgi:hypothetical protein
MVHFSAVRQRVNSAHRLLYFPAFRAAQPYRDDEAANQHWGYYYITIAPPNHSEYLKARQFGMYHTADAAL